MTHLLDTNCCVEYLRRGTSTPLAARLAAAGPGEVALCSVVVAELLYGAHRSDQRAKTLDQVRAFCSRFASLAFNDAAAEEYGRMRAGLEALGASIGPNDLMIASIALAHDLTLVTHNVGEFSRVPGLKLEDWQAT